MISAPAAFYSVVASYQQQLIEVDDVIRKMKGAFMGTKLQRLFRSGIQR